MVNFGGPDDASWSPELRAAVASAWVERTQIARAMGITFDGKRDLGEVLGYKQALGAADYCARYERGGIAARAVETMPKATWRGGVWLIEDRNPEVETEFERAWNELAERLDVVPRLLQVDVLSQLSHFAVLVLGDGQALDKELAQGGGDQGKLLYLAAYLGAGGPSGHGGARPVSPSMALQQLNYSGTAAVKELVRDPKDARFGRPASYQLHDPRGVPLTGDGLDNVHPSRVIHVAERTTYSDLFSLPLLERVWNYFDDLDKVVGGGAEAFYQRANQGRVWSIDPKIKDLSPAEKESFREQVERFQHGEVRDVRARGLSLNTTSSDVADFAGSADEITKLIAGALSIPQRILTGSEMGELASSQDRDNFRDQVNGRRENYAGPRLLLALGKRLVQYGYLPAPASMEAEWGAVMNYSREERNSIISAWSSARTDEGQLFTNAEIRNAAEDMAPLTDEQRAEIEEALDAKARRTASTRVPPAARFAEERDGELVNVLRDAIEADAAETVLAILGFDPDQPRDEQGRWVHSDAAIAHKAAGAEHRRASKSFLSANDPTSGDAVRDALASSEKAVSLSRSVNVDASALSDAVNNAKGARTNEDRLKHHELAAKAHEDMAAAHEDRFRQLDPMNSWLSARPTTRVMKPVKRRGVRRG